MESFLGIFKSLGVNSSIWTQLAIFVVFYFLFTYLFIVPYFEAYLVRQKKTVGSEEKAQEFVEKTKQLEEEFQYKARELNEEIRKIYDSKKSEAAKEQEQVIQQAREQIKTEMDRARALLKAEVEKAQAALRQESPEISQLIKTKLMSKEH